MNTLSSTSPTWIRKVREAVEKTGDISELRFFLFVLLFSKTKKIALERPILFSNWLTKEYTNVGREELRNFVKARLKVFAGQLFVLVFVGTLCSVFLMFLMFFSPNL
jgi:hypothetical protein